MLPIFNHEAETFYCEDQKRRRHMLAGMIHDGLPWYEETGKADVNFEDILYGTNHNAIASALEECTTDEIAIFLQMLANIIRDEI